MYNHIKIHLNYARNLPHSKTDSSTSAALTHFQICKDDLEISFSFHKSSQEIKNPVNHVKKLPSGQK